MSPRVRALKEATRGRNFALTFSQGGELDTNHTV
jgi:hypothetical protein